MTDELKRTLLNDILDRTGKGFFDNLIIEQNNTINVAQALPTQMPPYLTREQGILLYNFLTQNGYVESSTPAENFLYLMGVTGIPPEKLKSINWLKTVQQLHTMLTQAFRTPIELKSIKLAEIERRAAECFLNKGCKMQRLAKPREENSIDLDNLLNFFRLF